MKKFFILRWKYPKLLLLVIFILLSYIIFREPAISNFFSGIEELSYLGVFIAGMFFAFGFSAPFAVGMFIVLNPSNIFIAALIGGLGAVTSDILIFRFIRVSFKDEFIKLGKTKTMRKLDSFIGYSLGKTLKTYLIYFFIAFLFASPLPDEAAVILLAGMTKVKTLTIAILGFILNAIGILIILLI